MESKRRSTKWVTARVTARITARITARVTAQITTRIIVVFFSIAIIILNISPIAFASNILRDESESVHLNIVMLVDETASMIKSDPEKISVQGAMLFADLIEISDSAISVVGFSENPRSMGNKLGEMRVLYDFDDHHKLVAEIKDDVQKDRKGTTNIATAMEAAVMRMEKVSESQKKRAVVLFTDGKNEFENDDLKNKKKAADDKCLELAEKLHYDYECELYIVALNINNSINRELLEGMILANRAGRGGELDEFLYEVSTSSVKDLPKFFQDAFARLIGSKANRLTEEKGLNEVNFSVTAADAPVDEIDIVIFPTSEKKIVNGITIDGISCKDKDGVVKDLFGADYIYVSEQDRYTLVKIRRDKDKNQSNPRIPEGDWTIKLGNTSADVLISVFGMKNENIVARVQSESTVPVGIPASITAEIYDGNNEPFNASRIGGLQKAEAVVTNSAGELEASIPLKANALGQFEAEWTPKAVGDYYVMSRFVEDGAVIESRLQHVEVARLEDVSVTGIEIKERVINIKEGKSKPLSDVVTLLPEGADTSGVVYVVEDDTLVAVSGGNIQGLRVGSTVVAVTLLNGKNETFGVSVIPKDIFVDEVVNTPTETPNDIEVKQNDVKMKIGDEIPLSDVVVVVPPSSISDYQMSGDSVAIGNIEGTVYVRAVKGGSAEVTITSSNGNTAVLNFSVEAKISEPDLPTYVLGGLAVVIVAALARFLILSGMDKERSRNYTQGTAITTNGMEIQLPNLFKPRTTWITGKKLARYAGIKPDSAARKLKIRPVDENGNFEVKGVAGVTRIMAGSGTFTAGNLKVDIK